MQINFVHDESWTQEKLFPGERVRVYKNLHRNCYSVLRKYYDPEKKRYSWLVWNYLTEMTLFDPKFIVRESGRQRVIKEKKKNVHAFIEGSFPYEIPPKFRENYHINIRYNPYTDEGFNIRGLKPDRELTEVYLDIEYGVYI